MAAIGGKGFFLALEDKGLISWYPGEPHSGHWGRLVMVRLVVLRVLVSKVIIILFS